MKTTNNQLSCYLIEKTIGKGTFGKVKKAIHKYTGEPVAIKILEKEKIKDITDVERVSRQLHILKLVRHSSIAQLYEIIQTPETIYIVMQYAQNGEFFDYIMDAKIKNQQEAHYYFVQIVSGLDYLHRMKIAHRDIKPQNMLLDVHNRLKVVDFGLSNMYKQEQKLVTACGSPCYASPEMIKGQEYDPELTDVWSLGIVLFTMLLAKLPFEDDNTSVLYGKIKSGLYIIDKKVSSEFKDLISKLININPASRLRLSEIKQHAWFKLFEGITGHGITVGYESIPIDDKIVNTMEEYGFSSNQTKRFLSYNIKNQCTATYYLYLKKKLKQGHPSTADICSDHFNQQLLGKPIRKLRHKSIDFNALVEKSETNCQASTKVKFKQQRYASQIKNKVDLEVQSVTKISNYFSSYNKKSTKKFNLFNFNSKNKELGLRKDTSVGSKQKSKRKFKLHLPQDENNEKMENYRQNRRLKTDHVREVYGVEMKQGGRKDLQISEMFWKKKKTSHVQSKGQTRYARQENAGSSKRLSKNSYY